MKNRKGKANQKRSTKKKSPLMAKRSTLGARRQANRAAKKRFKATAKSAREFLSKMALRPRTRRMRGETAQPQTLEETGFQAAKDQAAVVGSEIISFVTGVSEERRQAIANASLIAQFYASDEVPDRDNIDAWYRVYFNTLTRLGWDIQEYEFKEYEEHGESLEAHKAILKVATALMASASPAALPVIIATLEALQSMNADDPWITLFNRESHSARVARFQVSLVEQGEGKPFMVRTMAFALEVKTGVTQVLFFKYRSSDAKLRFHSGKVTINIDALDGNADLLRQTVAQDARDFIKTLPPLRRR